MRKPNSTTLQRHKTRLAELALANVVLVRHSAFDDDELRVINWKTGKDLTLNGLQASCIMHEKIKWNALLCVFIQNEKGSDWIYEQVEANPPCLQSELVDLFNQKHYAIASQVPAAEIVGMGWIYSAKPRDIDDEKALAIFEQCLSSPIITTTHSNQARPQKGI